MKRLPDTTKITLRLPVADLEVLHALFPRRTNAVIRTIVAAYCARLREAAKAE